MGAENIGLPVHFWGQKIQELPSKFEDRKYGSSCQVLGQKTRGLKSNFGDERYRATSETENTGSLAAIQKQDILDLLPDTGGRTEVLILG
jgi:hypothetical protein